MSIVKRFKNAVKAFTFDPTISPNRIDGSWFYPIWSSTSNTFSDLQLLKDFTEIPEISGIISMKARSFSKMIVRQVSKETGQDMRNQQNLIKVLRDPNWFQSWKEFMIQTKTFREIFGNEYIYINYPYGFPSRQAKAMFTIPPHLVTTETKDETPFYLQLNPQIEYKFKWGNKEYEIAKDNICHLNDNRVEMKSDNWVDGQSWLAYQRAAVNNIRSAYKTRGVLLDNMGVQGIFTNSGSDVAGAMLMDETERKDLRERLNRLGKNTGEFPALITSLALDWKKMGVENPQNLGLYDEVNEDFYRLCDAAGVPSILFSNATGATFENQKWAERRLYENTIIPEAEEWIGALNSFFNTENESWEIVGSYSHLNVFQENLRERGIAMKQIMDALVAGMNGQLIQNDEAREELRKLGLVVSQ